jgi:large subunit ribosomal protein L14e
MAVEIGKLAIKIAGRDAGQECVVIDVIDKNFVMIEGNTRRKKCNIGHLHFLPHKLKVKKGATRAEVKKAMEDFGIKVHEKAPAREKKVKEAPKKEEKKGLFEKAKKAVKKKAEEKKPAKKTTKKTIKKPTKKTSKTAKSKSKK